VAYSNTERIEKAMNMFVVARKCGMDRSLKPDCFPLSSVTAIATAIVATIGLIFSAYALYLVHFRSARISSVIGPQIMAFYRYHGSKKEEESIGLIVPLTFTNMAVRAGVIMSTSLLLWRDDNPNERLCSEWNKFGKLVKEGNQWVHAEEPHPLPVIGNSSITKMAFFYWFRESSPRSILREGLYHIALSYRISGKKDQVEEESNELFISAKKAKLLESVRKSAPAPKKPDEIVATKTVYLKLNTERETCSQTDAKT
jgi:hypothetical protein